MTKKPRFNQNTFIGLFSAAFGLLLLFSSREIEIPNDVVIAGPELFPILIGSGLLTLGLIQLVASIRNSFANVNSDITTQTRNEWRPTLWILGGIGAFLVTLRPFGLILAGTLLFFFVTLAFEPSKWKTYTVIGLLVSVFVFLLFSTILGLQIPLGRPFELILR